MGAGIETSLRTDRAGRNYIRVSPHFYNTDDEIHRSSKNFEDREMTNDEARMTNQLPNDSMTKLRHSRFVLDWSFVLRA